MPLLERWLQRVERSRPLREVTALMLQQQLGHQVLRPGVVDLGR